MITTVETHCTRPGDILVSGNDELHGPSARGPFCAARYFLPTDPSTHLDEDFTILQLRSRDLLDPDIVLVVVDRRLHAGLAGLELWKSCRCHGVWMAGIVCVCVCVW